MCAWRITTAGALLAAGLAGCSSSYLGERLPESMGGLPAGAPAAPTQTYQYPAVHDMPPDRPVKPLSDPEQTKLENDLRAARDQQEKEAADAAAGAMSTPQPAASAPTPVQQKTSSKKKHRSKNAAGDAAKAGAAGTP